MYDDVYGYSLETILEHITVYNKRFSEIYAPTDVYEIEKIHLPQLELAVKTELSKFK